MVDRATFQSHTSGGISPHVLYKLRLDASADVGGKKGGTAPDGRAKIDFLGSVASHMLPTAWHRLRIHSAGPSCVTQMDEILR